MRKYNIENLEPLLKMVRSTKVANNYKKFNTDKEIDQLIHLC